MDNLKILHCIRKQLFIEQHWATHSSHAPLRDTSDNVCFCPNQECETLNVCESGMYSMPNVNINVTYPYEH
jgi:hypothetical protein